MKSQKGISVAPLIIPDHSAFFVHHRRIQSENNQFIDKSTNQSVDQSTNQYSFEDRDNDVALGMLRDMYGVQLIMEDSKQYLLDESSGQFVNSSFKSTGGSFSLYLPGHSYNDIGGIFLYLSLGIHTQLSFVQHIVTLSDQQQSIYQTKDIYNDPFIMYKFGVNLTLQITPHLGVKPWAVYSGSDKKRFMWEPSFLEKILDEGTLQSDTLESFDRYKGELLYGISLYIKIPVWPLPFNCLISFKNDNTLMIGLSLFDYNSYRFNNPKYYIGKNTQFLKPVRESK